MNAVRNLTPRLLVGDLVFIRIPARPFREVADATGTWTNHVGVVIDVDADGPMVAESRFPFSCLTRFSAYVARSQAGRFAVLRLRNPPTPLQAARIRVAAQRRLGVFYDTGFNLHSRRQFCSRYVREVLLEATGLEVGDIQTFAQVLAVRPDANLGFWKWWYFGRIPWNRETVSPASLITSPTLQLVFEDSVRPEQGLSGQ